MLSRLVLAAALALAPAAAQAERATVFAAASMKTALDAIAAAWEARTGDDIALSYAGSSLLARQIVAGAPADLFISASPEWMDAVEAEGAATARRDLLGNALVLIAAAPTEPVALGPDLDLAGLLGEGRLAMALVDAVPAGIYGKAALEALDLWEAAAPRLAQADNARAALALVAAGEAPLGIVYATDAAAEPRVKVIGVFPEETHPPIVYPVALLTENAAARAFYDELGEAPARAVFAREGFRVLDGE